MSTCACTCSCALTLVDMDDSSAVFDAVCNQIDELKSAHERAQAHDYARKERTLLKTLRECSGKPWRAREGFDAQRALTRLRAQGVVHVQRQGFGGKRKRTCARDRSSAAPWTLSEHVPSGAHEGSAADVYRALFESAALQDSLAAAPAAGAPQRLVSLPVDLDDLSSDTLHTTDEPLHAGQSQGQSPSQVQAGQGRRGLEGKSTKRVKLTRAQADVVDALLQSEGLPPKFEVKLRGDVCDVCPGAVDMRIAANDSLLECPRCGVARLLSSATAATAGAGNHKDYSTQATTKQKSRVLDVLEFTQGVQHKEPKPSVLAAVMTCMWNRHAQAKAARSWLNAALDATARPRPKSQAMARGPRARSSASAEIELEDTDANAVTNTCADGQQTTAPCAHALEDHAPALAAEVLQRGPFTSIEDALKRLPSLPCLAAHVADISYPRMYTELQKTYDMLKCTLKARNSAAQPPPPVLPSNAGAAQPRRTRPGTAPPLGLGQEDGKGAGEGAQGLSQDSAGDDAAWSASFGLGDLKPWRLTSQDVHEAVLKDVNASYELAAKVGAELSGVHGLRMLSQQREQIYKLHGILTAERERSGDSTRLPHRFTHDIRQLCLLLGFTEFLPLYPLPHPVGSPALIALEESLRAVFERLTWEFTPAQTELSKEEVRQRLVASGAAAVAVASVASGARGRGDSNKGFSMDVLRKLGIVCCDVKHSKRYFIAVDPLVYVQHEAMTQ